MLDKQRLINTYNEHLEQDRKIYESVRGQDYEPLSNLYNFCKLTLLRVELRTYLKDLGYKGKEEKYLKAKHVECQGVKTNTDPTCK